MKQKLRISKKFTLGIFSFLIGLISISHSFLIQAQALKRDGMVHLAPMKIITLRSTEFKTSPIAAKMKAKHPSTIVPETVNRKFTDGSNLKISLVKKTDIHGPISVLAHPIPGSSRKSTASQNGIIMECSSSMVNLTANSDSYLNSDYSTLSSHIYPGAVYNFKDFFTGNYKEQIGERYPITLVTNVTNLSGSSYVTINKPEEGPVNDGVNRLLHEMRGSPATIDYVTQAYESGSNSAQNLQVSGGGSYAGFSASDSYNTSSNSNTFSLTLDIRKEIVNMDIEAQDSIFKDKNIESNPNLVMISHVSYGVRILANLTYTFNSTAEADSFKAAYSGMGANANFNLNQASKNSSFSNTINLYVVGGGGPNNVVVDRKDLYSEVNKIVASLNYENAKPIEYEFTDMAGNSLGTNSSTDNFSIKTCVPNYDSAVLKSVFLTYDTGEDGKDNDTHYNMTLYPGKAQSNNNYNGYDNYPQTQNNNEHFLAAYKTGPLNVIFPTMSSHTDQLTINNYLYPAVFGGPKDKITLGYLKRGGGILHLHIYPNGHDTWMLRTITLKLYFEGGAPEQTIVFSGSGTGKKGYTLSESSTELTLYFDENLKNREIN